MDVFISILQDISLLFTLLYVIDIISKWNLFLLKDIKIMTIRSKFIKTHPNHIIPAHSLFSFFFFYLLENYFCENIFIIYRIYKRWLMVFFSEKGEGGNQESTFYLWDLGYTTGFSLSNSAFYQHISVNGESLLQDDLLVLCWRKGTVALGGKQLHRHQHLHATKKFQKNCKFTVDCQTGLEHLIPCERKKLTITAVYDFSLTSSFVFDLVGKLSLL